MVSPLQNKSWGFSLLRPTKSRQKLLNKSTLHPTVETSATGVSEKWRSDAANRSGKFGIWKGGNLLLCRCLCVGFWYFPDLQKCSFLTTFKHYARTECFRRTETSNSWGDGLFVGVHLSSTSNRNRAGGMASPVWINDQDLQIWVKSQSANH